MIYWLQGLISRCVYNIYTRYSYRWGYIVLIQMCVVTGRMFYLEILNYLFSEVLESSSLKRIYLTSQDQDSSQNVTIYDISLSQRPLCCILRPHMNGRWSVVDGKEVGDRGEARLVITNSRQCATWTIILRVLAITIAPEEDTPTHTHTHTSDY